MQPHPTLLKLSGYSSLEKLKGDFASYMIDVAHIAKEGNGYVLVAPDDPKDVQLHLQHDYEWLKRVVLESLKHAGEQSIRMSRHEGATGE